MINTNTKQKKSAPAEILNCKHITSILITFKGENSYYRRTPTKYVQKCLLCEQISDYCLNQNDAYASLMTKPPKKPFTS